jgi:starch-binding outer membrane protein, SusD/RagB family
MARRHEWAMPWLAMSSQHPSKGWDFMKISRFQSSLGRAGRDALMLVTAACTALLVGGCTDLDKEPTSSITPENFNKTETEVLGSLAAAYSDLATAGNAGLLWGYYNLSEISSDEMIVPTRGQDWFDNGRWLEIQHQGWTANSTSGLDDINGTWVTAFRGITRANVLLEALESVSVPNADVIDAEARSLRAFYYYVLMDMFGGVPIVTTPEIDARPRATREEVFRFIDDELNAVRGTLPDVWPAAQHGRMTKGAADAILASMYLNAGVFTSDAPNATAYNSCAGVQVGGGTACAAAIAAADRILNSGQYSLATDWNSNFTASNNTSPENIMVAKHSNDVGLGMNFVMRALHYNQINPTPWNGFAALAETYNAFDAADLRRNIFLVGPQMNLDTGDPAFDRQGNPLVFTVSIADPTQATEGEGPRILKYPPDPDRVAENNGNDYVYFRLGEIYLIKAEASLENGDAGTALTLVNNIRARAFEPDQPLAAVDRDAILRERLFELAGEGKRRQDLIRHGKFTVAWSFKQAGGGNLVLFPIPQPQLDANPMLQQNPGY